MYRPLDEDGIVRRLIGAAGAAPSIHNTQPWRFRVTGDFIELHGDPDRMLWVADPLGRALHLSCGAALFNLRLAVRALGAKPLVWPIPYPQREPTLLASVQLEPGRPATSQEYGMYEVIHQRHTSREPFSERPIPESVKSALEQEAGYEFAVLRMLNDRDAVVALDLAAAADKMLAAYFDHRVELETWIATEGDDGVPTRALGLRPMTEPAPVRDFGYASPATVRPPGRMSCGRSSRFCPPRATSPATGCEPDRLCSACCWRRPGTAWRRRSCISRSSCTTGSAETRGGGPGRNARR
jgi:nitroreductase